MQRRRKKPKTKPLRPAYGTRCGRMIVGQTEKVLKHSSLSWAKGKVQLIFTSPPFPLNKKKSYGNFQGKAYVEWLASYGPLFRDLLTPDGSIVLELGNAWVKGKPEMSTLPLEALLRFQKENKLHLCQEFICHNPARLPSPAQWVNIKRSRVKDSYTRLWWLSPVPEPKADNRRVLKEYSPSMQKLLKNGSYNAGDRPSQHKIGESSFLTNHGGAIPPSMLTYSNTGASDDYLEFCRRKDLKFHPARMPIGLAEFFIAFLTEPGDIVLDPFAGSNTTGQAAEKLKRHWLSIEVDRSFVRGSKGRFKKIRRPKSARPSWQDIR